MRFVHFFMAWTFVIVPGPLAAYAGSIVRSHSHNNRAMKFLGQALESSLWWWWLVAVPLVFILHI